MQNGNLYSPDQATCKDRQGRAGNTAFFPPGNRMACSPKNTDAWLPHIFGVVIYLKGLYVLSSQQIFSVSTQAASPGHSAVIQISSY